MPSGFNNATIMHCLLSRAAVAAVLPPRSARGAAEPVAPCRHTQLALLAPVSSPSTPARHHLAAGRRWLVWCWELAATLVPKRPLQPALWCDLVQRTRLWLRRWRWLQDAVGLQCRLLPPRGWLARLWNCHADCQSGPVRPSRTSSQRPVAAEQCTATGGVSTLHTRGPLLACMHQPERASH